MLCISPHPTVNASPRDISGLLQRPIPLHDRLRRRFVVVMIVAILAVYAGGVSSHWWVGSDSALYLNLARNMTRGDGYALAGRPHRLVPPGFPMLLSGLMRCGLDGFAALNVAMCLIGLTTVTASYLLLSRLVHRDWAVLLTLAIALTREMTQRSGEILSDVPFMLLVTAALCLYVGGLRRDEQARRGWEIASVLLVVACAVRLAGLAVAASAPLGLLLSARRGGRLRAAINMVIVYGLLIAGACVACHRLGGAGSSDATYGGLLPYRLADVGAWGLVVKVSGNLVATSKELSRLIFSQRTIPILCLIFVTVPVAVAGVRRFRRGDRLTPLIVLAYVGGLSFRSMLRTRYLLPLLPILLLYVFEFYVWLVGRLSRRRPVARRVAAVLLLLAVLGINLPKVFRTLYRKHRDDFSVMLEHGKWADLGPTVDYLRLQPPIDGVILSEQPVAYLADLPAPRLSEARLSASPEAGEIETLLAEWDVRYVVLTSRKNTPPFEIALGKHLESRYEPAFVTGATRVYRFRR